MPAGRSACIELIVNELRILWARTVIVAGWQMVKTPNYIAPAIGTSFLF